MHSLTRLILSWDGFLISFPYVKLQDTYSKVKKPSNRQKESSKEKDMESLKNLKTVQMKMYSLDICSAES